MTPRDRAERAKQLLDDPLLNEAFSGVRSGLIERLETCPIGDIDTQHEIALTLQLLKRLRVQLEQHLQEFRIVEAEKRQRDWMQKARQTIGI